MIGIEKPENKWTNEIANTSFFQTSNNKPSIHNQ